MKELRMTYLTKISISPHLFFFLSLLPLLIFLCFFSREIKMRGAYVGDNERKRECRECFLLLLLSTSFNVFLRDIKKEVCM